MRILAVEQHNIPSIGVVGETLRELAVETDTVWGENGDTLPSGHREHDGLVVLGGAMTALADDERPYFPALTRLIREFAEADKPVLGICLGAQLIARAYDARLRLGGDFEFGYHTVVPTDAAGRDPVLSHMAQPLALFQWHTDHYDLPPGAERLVTADAYENQGYRIGRNVYGMQFHFEFTRPVVQNMIDVTPDLEEHAPGYRDWLPVQFANHEAASVDFCRTFTRRWVELAR